MTPRCNDGRFRANLAFNNNMEAVEKLNQAWIAES
jgi:hypothetical protein